MRRNNLPGEEEAANDPKSNVITGQREVGLLFAAVGDGIVPDYIKRRGSHLHSLGKRWT